MVVLSLNVAATLEYAMTYSSIPHWLPFLFALPCPKLWWCSADQQDCGSSCTSCPELPSCLAHNSATNRSSSDLHQWQSLLLISEQKEMNTESKHILVKTHPQLFKTIPALLKQPLSYSSVATNFKSSQELTEQEGPFHCMAGQTHELLFQWNCQLKLCVLWSPYQHIELYREAFDLKFKIMKNIYNYNQLTECCIQSSTPSRFQSTHPRPTRTHTCISI